MNPFFRFIEKYYYLFGAILIIVGFIVGVFGKPLFKPTICIVGAFVFLVVALLFIFSVFFNKDTPQWVSWLVFIISLIFGCIIGLILAKLSRLGVAVLAGWGGFCLGLVLYNAFIYKIDNTKRVAFWIVNISLGVICGIASIFLFNHVLIFATSIVGSYAFIRGISLYAGGYPDELDLIELIKYGGDYTLPNSFYGYMAGFIVASIICIII